MIPLVNIYMSSIFKHRIPEKSFVTTNITVSNIPPQICIENLDIDTNHVQTETNPVQTVILSTSPYQIAPNTTQIYVKEPGVAILNKGSVLVSLGHGFRNEFAHRPNFVNTITVDSSENLFVGGILQNSAHLAKWDPSTSKWTYFLENPEGPVQSIMNGKDMGLYVGSENGIQKWDESTRRWSNLGKGVNKSANVISDISGELYVGGLFTSAGDISTNFLAKWDIGLQQWSGIDGLASTGSTISGVYTIVNDSKNGKVYIGGNFLNIDGTSHLASWDGSSWTTFGNIGNRGSIVSSIVIDTDGGILIGGMFTISSGISNIAKWNSIKKTWSSVGGGVNNTVHSMAFDPSHNELYVGGNFTKAGDHMINYVAKWDGVSWKHLEEKHINHTVRALRFSSKGDLYIGGQFKAASGLNAIAKYTRNYVEMVANNQHVWNLSDGMNIMVNNTNGISSVFLPTMIV